MDQVTKVATPTAGFLLTAEMSMCTNCKQFVLSVPEMAEDWIHALTSQKECAIDARLEPPPTERNNT